ncbi:hypothetical protein [Pseudomonas sp. FW300-N2A2]|uniref:hypothetical protein n=1 Tax=Pseudomonas sp. FW300-N2A2 TaxID=2751316 RepID=UPI001A939503|nr:hypothetical protein [Pseudomonas sp. FW300-N2A2]
MNVTQISASHKALEVLMVNAAKLPAGEERKIRQIIGETDWEPLIRQTRHYLGKQVRANPERFGLVFVRRAGSIAVYKKFCI